MWIFSQEGFYSAVRSDRDEQIMVRARVRQDLVNLKAAYERCFEKKDSEFKVVETENTDYRYRIVMSQTDWIGCLTVLGAEIDYPNFKSRMSQRPDQKNKVAVLHKIWSLMLGFQPLGPRLGSPKFRWDPESVES